ncbi:hypothetical protein MOV66_22440 [Agrobacterium sp. SHOUNA12C]|uniref:Uncharacterized protein n=2 Tax=Rhizobium rhizogenes TaxID=359 RepID=B9JFT8_RHIR8|nr:hypothetical protein [Rhizobium rhizogenes]ACM26778.1 conserved hypothetical protein [Rhizobium rhizogenes K84]KAA6489777.1 hypothetical protein DXT98_05175 [Agrobacterium sp. ICMP 7243]MCJ9725454.1 hypothetical protein [Agrobacterium sp. BETTINA12B]MCJ9759423.1 hypothetical protein [Agrobacterium sp. SHOUNA12C]OCJ05941.1 hypothetical protein A6U85_02925 [Agrobacterium sp. 13-626]OCJ25848.1 hypothetical protein A6U88_05280 [Agrobacterium sp. B131/95]OCJ31050.1 hypothetical protein A6U89_0
MFSRQFLLVSGFAAAALSLGAWVHSADAGSRDKAFFQSVAGSWRGPGEIVAGKYKGTKFTCNLTGQALDSGTTGVKLDGTCRVGVFQQPMSAEITQNGGSYNGKFLDGAAGKGLDITSGTVSDGTVVLGLNRQKLNGAMIARVTDNKSMNVTISVKVGEQMVPVIGVTLQRADVDQMAVGSIQ